MIAVQPARSQEEEKDEGAGAEDPVKELIRLVVQTLLREEVFQVCSDVLEYRKNLSQRMLEGCWNWRGNWWTWGDFTPVSRPDGRNGRRKAPSTRNRPLRCSWML